MPARRLIVDLRCPGPIIRATISQELSPLSRKGYKQVLICKADYCIICAHSGGHVPSLNNAAWQSQVV